LTKSGYIQVLTTFNYLKEGRSVLVAKSDANKEQAEINNLTKTVPAMLAGEVCRRKKGQADIKRNRTTKPDAV
jgi:hypothetical protein